MRGFNPIRFLSPWQRYKAGASRAQRWSRNGVTDTSVRTFLKNIDFPATRKYVESIIDRYKFYQRRGRM